MRKLLFLPLFALLLSTSGCIEKALTNGQIEATRRASGAFDTIGDYELARSAAEAGMVQFEGMHRLAPDNEDGLFLLTQGWTGYGYGIVEDDMELAQDAGDESLAEYHKRRARMAYDRAIFYGLELLSHRDDGFKNAKKNDLTFRAWLKEHFDDKDDVPNLFWTGYGWLAKVNLLKDDPEQVADLFIPVAMLERSVELDPGYFHWGATLALAAYHSRAAVAELDQGKQMFETVIAKTNRKSLLSLVTYAQTYACVKNDRALYEKLLNEVLAADDPDPNQRLNSTLAKRRAKRYLGRQRMLDCGFDMSAPAAPPGKKG
jgi:hypothetical protein